MVWIADSECPPSAKNSSWTPTWPAPKVKAQIPASSSSSGERGGTQTTPAKERSAPGAGSRSRSSLPLRVSGSASRSTNAEGTMYSGTTC